MLTSYIIKCPARKTFERAYWEVLENAAITPFVDNTRPVMGYNLLNAARRDWAAANNLLDLLCQDLSKIAGRRLAFRAETFPVSSAVYPEDTWGEFQYAYESLVRCKLRQLFQDDSPVGRIRRTKGLAFTHVTRNQERVGIYLPDPKEVTPARTPEHIIDLLHKLKWTNYNYQPYILGGSNGEKVLALRLGNKWADIAIASWEEVKSSTKELVLAWSLIGIGIMCVLDWPFNTIACPFVGAGIGYAAQSAVQAVRKVPPFRI